MRCSARRRRPPKAVLATPRDHFLARGGAALRELRHLLLPTLHAVNDRVGWISRGAINYIAERLDVAPAEIYGVATFYALFSLDERPARQVHVCVDLACRAAGGLGRARPPAGHPSVAVPRRVRAGAGGAGRSKRAIRNATRCSRPRRRSRCAASPMARGPGAEAPVIAAVPQVADDDRRSCCCARVGRVDPTSLDDYRATGGYEALRRAFAIGPAEVIREVTDSGLVGRGGAAFPTGRKWDAVARQPARPHHLVCNADESEPGTFKDRVLIEGDPFALIESMTIAGFATGCAHGWVYLRGEYPRALDTLAGGARRGAPPAATSATTSSDPGSRSTSRCSAAPAPTSAARRRRSSTRSRGSAASRATSRRSRSRSGCSASRRSSTTSRRSSTSCRSWRAAVRRSPRSAPRGRRAASCSACRARSPGPACSRSSSASRSRELLDLAGGVRGGAALQAILLGGAAGRLRRSRRPRSAARRWRAREPPAPRSARASCSCSTTPSTWSTSCGGSRRSSATSRAGSACRAASAPCARRRCSPASPPVRVTGDLELFRDLAQVMRDASICGLGQTAPSAIESAIDRLGVFQ